jgi:lysyl-tRNA synthetase class 2
LSELTNRSGLTMAEPGADDGSREPVTPPAQPPDRPASERVPDRRQQRRWVPRTARLLSMVIGLFYIVQGLLPGFSEHLSYRYRLHRIAEVTPFGLGDLTRVADIIIGLALVMLSYGLRKRKRRAWEAVTVLLAVNVVIHAVVHRPPQVTHLVSEFLAILVLVMLIAYRSQFYAVGDARNRWRALWALGLLAVADVAIGFTYLSVTKGLVGRYTGAEKLQSAVYNLVGFSGPVRLTTETRTDFFSFVTGALGLFTLLVVGYLFLRPAQPTGRLRPPDAAAIRGLLAKHGEQDSLGYFALRTDKSVIWSPTGKSCIGYRVQSGVMLASGDPIGDPEAWPGAIHAFLDEAARHAWVPAVIGCGEHGAEVWCREGDLTALELGDEAVVNVADFSMQGRQMRNVRQMVKRVCRQGYVAEIRRVGDIPPDEMRRLRRQAERWLGGSTERGFSMALGRIGGVDDDRCVVATATEDGVLRAILHFVPWGTDGLSLDLMRRDRSASPGLNDFLIVETIAQAAELGIKRISLNFAVFRAALERGERIGAGYVLRAWRKLLLFMSRWFQIESLYKFNAKFCPQWVPRFLVFPITRDLPRIGLAAMEAEAFLVWPTLKPRRIAAKLGLGRLRRRLQRQPEDERRQPRPVS